MVVPWVPHWLQWIGAAAPIAMGLAILGVSPPHRRRLGQMVLRMWGPKATGVAQSTPADRLRRHHPGLDGLRGLAILLVLLCHFSVIPGASENDAFVLKIFHGGWCGVELFFVLSGFLITGILIDSKSDSHFFRNFYARRALRIFPLYYGFLLIYCVVLPRIPGLGVTAPADYIARPFWFWTHLSNIPMALEGVLPNSRLPFFWTLAIEEQFYLVWPLVVWLLSRLALRVACVTLLLGCMCLRFWVLNEQALHPFSVYVFALTHLDGLVMGALIASLARSRWGLDILAGMGRFAGVLAVVALLGVLYLSGWDTDTNSRPMQTVGFTLMAVMFAGLLLDVVARPQALMGNVFNHSWLRLFGRYSYAIYIYHNFIAGGCKSWLDAHFPSLLRPVLGSILPAQFLFTGICTALSLAAAWVSWHVFESHFLKLKKFFSNRTKTLNGVEPSILISQTSSGNG